MFHAIMDIIGSESNWVTKTICKHLLSLVSCWWLWLIKTWSRDILWQKTIWASYHTVMNILNIQWSTCFLEIGLLLHMQCKWTQLSVTEDGINLDAWSLISSPYCSVRIIIQTLENKVLFFFFTTSTTSSLGTASNSWQTIANTRERLEFIFSNMWNPFFVPYLNEWWINAASQMTDSTWRRWGGIVDIYFGTYCSCSTKWDFNLLLEQV